MKIKDFKEIVIKAFSPVLIDYSMKFVSIKKKIAQVISFVFMRIKQPQWRLFLKEEIIV